ncbi:MAG TPA: cupin domain-containing protein [Chloroflexia bacterium]
MLTEEIAPTNVREVVLPPGAGEMISPGMFIKLRSEHTGGGFAMVEATMPPRTQGPALHVHTREDETFYILEGALRVRVGEQTLTAQAGSTVFMPRGVPHTFCNPFEEPVRALGVITPGGFERFFEDQLAVLQSVPEGGRPDPAAFEALGRKYGGVMMGPPMPLDE